MLTEDQKGVIERIPSQGELNYTHKDRSYSFTQDQVNEAVQESFTGKAAPAKKIARIMMGAPGSGKTTLAQEWMDELPAQERRGIIFIGYNERGAEANFAPCMAELMNAGNDFEKKLDVTNKYRPITQKIQNEAMKRALREEFSVLMDITAERKGAGFLIDALRAAGYERIELIGVHARFDIACGRAEERPTRPTDPFDIVDKRTGVIGYYKAHAEKCDLFEMYSNNYYGISAQKIFTQEPGKAPMDVDFSALQRMCDDLSADVSSVQAYLKKIKSRPDCRERVDIKGMTSAYATAAQSALEYFGQIQKTGVAKPATYVFGCK